VMITPPFGSCPTGATDDQVTLAREPRGETALAAANGKQYVLGGPQVRGAIAPVLSASPSAPR
jgi:hypothetical protein